MNSRVCQTIASFSAPGGTLVAIGNFDGVHRGHQEVLQSATSQAAAEGLTPLVLTFEPHPAEVLTGTKFSRLTALPRKVELLLRVHPELHVVVERFQKQLSLMSPEAFVQDMLVKGLSARRVVVGENFRFGHRRAGDLPLLVDLGQALGFEAAALELVGDDQGPYSSTRVRDALGRGDPEGAQAVLGRPHSLSGRVVVGDQRGRQLGFPTANLADMEEVQPKPGVYAVFVDQDLGDRFGRLAMGAMNIGVRPTVEAGASTEVHLLDFDGDLYGRVLRVHVMTRLRDEQKFSGLEALKQQLRADVANARDRLDELKPGSDLTQAWF